MARLYLDANILIYLNEGHEEFEIAAEQLLKRAISAGDEIVISDLCLCECLLGATKKGNQTAVERYNFLADPSQGDFTLIETTISAFETVPDLAAEYGLKLVDAMHLSLALQAGCDAFATNDGGFARADDVIDIVRLD